MINLQLAEHQQLTTEAIVAIERLHAFRDSLHNSIECLMQSKQRKLTYEVGQMLFTIEEELQKLWKFPVHRSYYKFWNVPLCRCAKMDNNDRFPTGRYIISGDCWLHSKEEV